MTAMKTQPTTSKWKRIMSFGTPGREFLRAALSGCGWLGETTEEEYDVPLRSTTYLNWWALKPSEIAKRFKAKLGTILLEAT
jgi:hypothetical protein